MIQLVACDIAGTTVNDGGAVYDALRVSVEETGALVAAADLQTWMGADKVTAIRALLRIAGYEPDETTVQRQFERFRQLVLDTYRAHPPAPIDGVPQAIAALRSQGIRVALTTGFDQVVVSMLLDGLGWTVGGAEATVDAVVTTSDVPDGRPAPYLIHHAMELTGVSDVRQVVAVGDTAVDLQAARNAGVRAVGVLTGKAGRDVLEQIPHDELLDSAAELPAYVAGLASVPA